MRTTPKFTPALKNSITRDWRNHFPSLGVYKPMRLLKRHGPILIGVALDITGSNDRYIPTFHIHNLIRPFPCVGLALRHVVPGKRVPQLDREIKIDMHAEEYCDAIEFLKHVAPELGFSVLGWPFVIAMYSKYVRQKRDYNIAKYCSNIFAEVILLARWCGHEDYARRCYDEALGLMRQWNPPIDLAEWQAGVDALTTREQLNEVLESEIVKHKLQHIPVYGFDPGGTAESITQAYVESWASP